MEDIVRKLNRVILFVVVVLLASLPVFADPALISVNGFADTSLAVDPSQVLAVAWTQTVSTSATAVNISFDGFFLGGTFTAYLMDGIGPLASFINEVAAPASFTMDPFQELSSINLWSGLTLFPSTYYVVVGTTDPNAGGGWGATYDPTIVTSPGVTLGDAFGFQQFYAWGPDIDLSYLPASLFMIDPLADGSLLFEVTVPEPSTLLLLSSGVLSLMFIRRKRSA
jgi:hypothetical protein